LFELEEYCRLNNSVFAVIKHFITLPTFAGGIGFMGFSRYGIPDKVLNHLARDLAKRKSSGAKSECMQWRCPSRLPAEGVVKFFGEQKVYEDGICPECVERECKLFEE
jgi:hypothetical protein